MRSAAYLFALAAPVLFAAVDGTVMNQTTGKPQGNVIVSLVQPGQGGMQTLATVKTDATGKFRIDKTVEGMQLLQAVYAGVPYNKMLQPGAPTTGVEVDVFDATTDRAAANLTQHIVFLQPAGGQLTVNEVYFVTNSTKQTFNDPKDGALRFYVPGHTAQDASVQVTVNAPGGMPVQRPAESTNKPGIYRIAYPLKPGETQFTLQYTLPATEKFASRNVEKVDTRLVAPMGVTLEGEGVASLGADPSGKAALFSVSGDEYSVKIGGTATAQTAAASEEDDSGAPQITQVKPRIYAQLPVVLALAFAVLLLGFVLLYRNARTASKGNTRR